MARFQALATGILAACLSASALPALAQDAKGSAASAKELYDQGVDLFARDELAAAEAKFREAWEKQKGYDIAANLGEVEMQLGKPAEAAAHLKFALETFPASGKQEKRDWLERRLKDARAAVFGVRISVNVPGAEVKLNGKPVGKSPLSDEVLVPPGPCAIEVTAPDHEPWTRTIEARKGGSERVEVELARPPRSLLPALVAGGVGVASVAVGAVLYAISTDRYDQAKRLHDEIAGGATGPASCGGPGAHPLCGDLESTAKMSDALFGPGVGLLAGGAFLTAAGGAYLGWALRPPSSSAKGSGKGPRVESVGVRGANLWISGSF